MDFADDEEQGSQAPAGDPVPDVPERATAVPATPAAVEREAVEDAANLEDGAKPEGATQRARDVPAPAPVVVEQEAPSGDADGPLRAGIVEFWHMHDRYGFIRPDDRGEPPVWADAKALDGFAEALPHLAKGERVLYEAVPSESRSRNGSTRQDGRQQAIRVQPEPSRLSGVVREYSFMHGYGTVVADDGARWFLHRSNILEGDYQTVSAGDRVFFTTGESDTRSGPDPAASAVKLGDPRPALYRFAQFPHDPGRWLRALANKAAREDWGYRHEHAADRAPYPILRHYLEATFERLLEERRLGHPTILEGATAGGRAYAVFDTGLLDYLGGSIYALFDEHRVDDDPRKWWWRGFFTSEEGPMREVAKLPCPADYHSDPRLLTITPAELSNMRVDTKHILVDHLDRFPEHLRSDPELAKRAFESERHQLADRVRRNYRLPVAQFYRGSIHLLLPLDLGGPSRGADLALVIERTAAGARHASTALGNDHAYQQARVIARPEADWLGHAWLDPDDAAPAQSSTDAGEMREGRRSAAA